MTVGFVVHATAGMQQTIDASKRVPVQQLIVCNNYIKRMFAGICTHGRGLSGWAAGSLSFSGDHRGRREHQGLAYHQSQQWSLSFAKTYEDRKRDDTRCKIFFGIKCIFQHKRRGEPMS